MKKCKCVDEKIYKVVFDASENLVNDEWLICSNCNDNNEAFQKYRISTKKIEEGN